MKGRAPSATSGRCVASTPPPAVSWAASSHPGGRPLRPVRCGLSVWRWHSFRAPENTGQYAAEEAAARLVIRAGKSMCNLLQCAHDGGIPVDIVERHPRVGAFECTAVMTWNRQNLHFTETALHVVQLDHRVLVIPVNHDT